MKRHFILHVGGTNTGKTYDALQKLKSSEKGCYLAPLRLLAMEIYDSFNKEGVLCELQTGEEEILVKNANITSRTVEKADFYAQYDVAVIDECQMLEDASRGQFWTKAIMDIQAKEIHLCLAEYAKKICIFLIERCGDTYEIIEHQRKVPLVFEDKTRFKLNQVAPGDALIVFSRKDVLALAAELKEKNYKVSVIYGALPYENRKKEVEKFFSGITSIVVATDCIGMGLNLPIKRVVFMKTQKFDGETFRNLLPSEIQQIAGRAGRYKMYQEGIVLAAENQELIKNGLLSCVADIKEAFLPFTINNNTNTSLEEDYCNYLNLDAAVGFKKMIFNPDVKEMIDTIASSSELRKISKEDAWRAICIPFSWKDFCIQWNAYLCEYVAGTLTEMHKPRICSRNPQLWEVEGYYKALDFYFSFAKFARCTYDEAWLQNQRKKTIRLIAQLLKISLQKKRCLCCGAPLEWNSQGKLCDDCFIENRRFNI